MATKDLKDRIDVLERKLSASQQRSRRRARPSLAAEINELERSLNAMSYMEDEIEDFGEEDIVVDDPAPVTVVEEEDDLDDDEFIDGEDVDVVLEPGMDDEPGMDEEPDMMYMDDEPGMDDESGMAWMEEEEVGCGRTSSEVSPGVEDEITQDYLDEMLEETSSTVETTGDSMLDVAPTEYVARLVRASARLDRVATYLERQGRVNLATRIDAIADAIDARAKKASRRA